MELPAKKWTFRLGDMPEVFVSGKSMSSAVSKAVKDGRLRKIGSRLYTKNKMEAPDVLVKRNWHALLKEYFPDALIADRTALENRPAPDGSVFIISSGTRPVELPGVTFRPRQGHPALPSDLPFLGGVHVCSTARGWLDNMRKTRSRSTESARTLSKSELEDRLEALIRQNGEASLNRLRDDARRVSQDLGMAAEFKALDELL